MRVRPLVLALVGGAVLVAAAAARSAPAPACTGRFVVHGGAGLLAGATVVTDTVLVDAGGRTVALEPGCRPIRARVKGTKQGTKVTCTWRKNACGVPGKVKLRGRTATDCRTLSGTVKVGRSAVPFTAASCGDGVVDAANGEACDGDGGCPDGLVCVVCRCGTATTTTTLAGGSTTTTRPVGFAREVYPILSGTCLGAGCHAGAFPAQSIDMETAAKAYTALTTKEASPAAITCAGMPLVAAGNPAASVLVKKLTGTSCGSQMPLGRPMLPAADLATISAWIAQGAQDD